MTLWLGTGPRRRAHPTASGVQLHGPPAAPDARRTPPPQPGSVPDSNGRHSWLARLASSPGLLVAVMLAVWLTTSLWGREPPSGDDTMAHLIRAQFTLDELVPHAQLDGWQSRFGLGYQQFLFYGPGFTWAVVLLHWLSLGLLSVAGAFKVAAIACSWRCRSASPTLRILAWGSRRGRWRRSWCCVCPAPSAGSA